MSFAVDLIFGSYLQRVEADLAKAMSDRGYFFEAASGKWRKKSDLSELPPQGKPQSFSYPDNSKAVPEEYLRGGYVARPGGAVEPAELLDEVRAPKTAADVVRDRTSKDTNPKTTYGALKPPLGLVPSAALIETALVFQDGEMKYGQANWREDPVSTSTYVNALLRHLLKYIDGVERDPESGRKELAHVAANAMILLDAEACGTLIDDRGPKGPAEKVLKENTRSHG